MPVLRRHPAGSESTSSTRQGRLALEGRGARARRQGDDGSAPWSQASSTPSIRRWEARTSACSASISTTAGTARHRSRSSTTISSSAPDLRGIDVQDTALLIGAVVDRNDGSTVGRVERSVASTGVPGSSGASGDVTTGRALRGGVGSPAPPRGALRRRPARAGRAHPSPRGRGERSARRRCGRGRTAPGAPPGRASRAAPGRSRRPRCRRHRAYHRSTACAAGRSR